MLLLAAPGQGAQVPGFLSPWLELPGFAERLAAWSPLAGCDLIRCGTVAGADEIRDTAVAQPLLVAAGLAVATEFLGGLHRADPLSVAAAGHSVGELTAGPIAGVISATDALALVRVRGQAMADAAAAQQTGMTAVLGGDQRAVLAAVAACGLTAANVNGSGQIVAAGTMPQLAALAADPPSGTRLRPLQVAGAFHTGHMAAATAALRAAAAGLTPADPALTVLANADGAVVRTGTDWLERIIAQVSMPVRWDLCMQAMNGLGVTALIELPPAGTLVGLARRALPGVTLLGLKTPDDLAAASQLLADHADSPADTHAPGWRLLVAPLAGTFRAGTDGAPSARPGGADQPGGGSRPGGGAEPGAAVDRGTELGRVEMRGGDHLVRPGFAATIIEWLVEDGDPVSVGQPLVRLAPRDSE